MSVKSESRRTSAHLATPHYLVACPRLRPIRGPQTRIDAYDVDQAWFIPVVHPFAPYYAAVEPTPTRN